MAAKCFFVSVRYTAMGSAAKYSQGFLKIDPENIRELDDFNGIVQREFGLGRATRPGGQVVYETITLGVLTLAEATKGLFHAQFESTVMGKRGKSCSAVLYIDFDSVTNLQQVKDMLMDDYNRRNPSPYNIDKRDGCFITSLSRLR